MIFFLVYWDDDTFVWMQAVSGELDHLDWFAPRSNCSFNSGTGSLALDDEFCMDFTDTLFSSLSSNQPFPFPNPREIGKFSCPSFLNSIPWKMHPTIFSIVVN